MDTESSVADNEKITGNKKSEINSFLYKVDELSKFKMAGCKNNLPGKEL
jgi:hypothetical protein